MEQEDRDPADAAPLLDDETGNEGSVSWTFAVWGQGWLPDTAQIASVWKWIFSLRILNIFKWNLEGNCLQKGNVSTFLCLMEGVCCMVLRLSPTYRNLPWGTLRATLQWVKLTYPKLVHKPLDSCFSILHQNCPHKVFLPGLPLFLRHKNPVRQHLLIHILW